MQVVLKHKGRPEEAAVLHHPSRWRLSNDVPGQQGADGRSEEGGSRLVFTGLDRAGWRGFSDLT